MKFFENHGNYISPKATGGSNVKIGHGAVIYDNVVIGDNSIISNHCVLGEPLNDYYSSQEYENPKLVIGKNALIRSHTIIYAGSQIGDNFQTGHNAVIRENMKIGNNCSVGTFCDLQGHSQIGNYCRLHSNVHVGQQTVLDDFVFIYPYVVFTNDPHPPSNICRGAKIGSYTQIAVHSVILPETVIGEQCLVGANSTVSGEFQDEQLIIGSPARAVGNINRIKSKLPANKNEAYYPWMLHFERGMPWEGVGYETWKEKNEL